MSGDAKTIVLGTSDSSGRWVGVKIFHRASIFQSFKDGVSEVINVENDWNNRDVVAFALSSNGLTLAVYLDNFYSHIDGSFPEAVAVYERSSATSLFNESSSHAFSLKDLVSSSSLIEVGVVVSDDGEVIVTCNYANYGEGRRSLFLEIFEKTNTTAFTDHSPNLLTYSDGIFIPYLFAMSGDSCVIVVMGAEKILAFQRPDRSMPFSSYPTPTVLTSIPDLKSSGYLNLALGGKYFHPIVIGGTNLLDSNGSSGLYIVDQGCDTGFAGSNCSECAFGYYGPNCTECNCIGSRSICNDGRTGNGSCSCVSSWTGSNCDTFVPSYQVIRGDKSFEPHVHFLSKDGKNLWRTNILNATVTHFQRSSTVGYFPSDPIDIIDVVGTTYEDTGFGSGGLAISDDLKFMVAGITTYKQYSTSNGEGFVLLRSRSSVANPFSDVAPEIPPYSADRTTSNRFFDRLGERIAVSADGNVIVASSPETDKRISSIGAVWSGDLTVWERAVSSSPFDPPIVLNNPEPQYNYAYMGENCVCMDNAGLTIATAAAVRTSYTASSYPTALREGKVYVWIRPNRTVSFKDNLPTVLSDVGQRSSYYFGKSIALAGDGLTLVAGSPYFSDGAEREGAVFIFERAADGVFSNTSYLLVRQPQVLQVHPYANVYFGDSVAISDDGLTLAASAQGSPNRGMRAKSDDDYGYVRAYKRAARSDSFLTDTGRIYEHPNPITVNDYRQGYIYLNGDGSTLVTEFKLNNPDDKYDYVRGTLIFPSLE
uniref:EGF-like domain-containing protein n=1 Tax=Palpitomonas bilix TaxID=652834 RepID=A0A7S3CYN5_9EUKA|mmetsp:Transcript_13949/g.35925  ORF Transcript_13949/g.35925 Transcript_13949/m.35925 type:complete len:764 (+) Transcript_13949:1974-4265(+)